MTITLKEAIDNFREQWNWIADETLRRKRKVQKHNYFEMKGIWIDRPQNECYLCEFSEALCISEQCYKCPVEWGGEIGNCCYKDAYADFKGLFSRWKNTNDYKKAARLAREIANLPLKEKYRKEYENAID